MIIETKTIIAVQNTFSFLLNLSPFLYSYSIESLVGKTQKGVANAITIRTPNRHTYKAGGVLPLGVYQGFYKMFYSSKIYLRQS